MRRHLDVALASCNLPLLPSPPQKLVNTSDYVPPKTTISCPISCHIDIGVRLATYKTFLTSVTQDTVPEAHCYRTSPLQAVMCQLADDDSFTWPSMQHEARAQVEVLPPHDDARELFLVACIKGSSSSLATQCTSAC